MRQSAWGLSFPGFTMQDASSGRWSAWAVWAAEILSNVRKPKPEPSLSKCTPGVPALSISITIKGLDQLVIGQHAFPRFGNRLSSFIPSSAGASQRLGKEFARLRHPVCRGAAPLRRILVLVAANFLASCRNLTSTTLAGLSPAISIQQKAAGRNPRSTVGTITEIYDYLRVLYARVGQGHCPVCGRPPSLRPDAGTDPGPHPGPGGGGHGSSCSHPSSAGQKANTRTCSPTCYGAGFRPRPPR